jgi:hypothetical protein
MLREYFTAHIGENCIISSCNVGIINCANNNDSGFTNGNTMERISWSRVVTTGLGINRPTFSGQK